MLFDEPTSALDPEMINEVLDVMVDLAKRRHDHDRRHPRDGLRPHGRRTGSSSWPTARSSRRPRPRSSSPTRSQRPRQGLPRQDPQPLSTRTPTRGRTACASRRIDGARRGGRGRRSLLAGCASDAGDRRATAPTTARPSTTDADVRRPAPRWRSSPRPATITIGTKFDQPGSASRASDGTPEGFDVEIAKISPRARHRRGQDRVGRDRLGQPRAVHPERPGRHRRRDLLDQRQAQARSSLRRPVLRGRPGPPGRARTTTDHRARRPRRQEGLLGDGLDLGREHQGQVPARRSCTSSTPTPSASTALDATARSTP